MQISLLKTAKHEECILLSLGICEASLTKADALSNPVNPGLNENVLADLSGTHEFHV